jgi:hypothetical protein
MGPLVEKGGLTALILTLAALFGDVFPVGGQEPRKIDLKPIMVQKLKHSQALLEGLSQEDFDLIRDRARELRKIGEESLARIAPNLTYVKYATEFVTIVDELDRRAKEEDLNGATVSYIRLTINCVECHKFTRDNRILDRRKNTK